MNPKISFSDFELNSTIHHQLSSRELELATVKLGMGQLTESGALAVKTGEFTGRSPKDRYIVKDHITEELVWWGDSNISFSPSKFDELHKKIISYLEGKDVYVRDCFAGSIEENQLALRVVNEYPWSNLFAKNMFIEPTESDLKEFLSDWVILNVPGFKAEAITDATRQHNFSIISFSKKTILIGGTAYTGEIKKGVFSVLNLILPKEKKVLPMHCAANVGSNEKTALFFGLSGTGKTTLSSDKSRKLIGDDEHGWDIKNQIFNFEGGCYAKVINLDKEKEPEIFDAIKKGALLENVIFDTQGIVDYKNDSITQNSRVSYPLNHIDNIKTPSIGENTDNIFFLTADAFGVLPPISKLTPAQAAYHFMSGYTAKISGTEEGVHEPIPSFSACFGGPFMPMHPSVYAEMLSSNINKSNVKVWLINTGWVGGPYGVGERIKLKYTRAMINAALNGCFEGYNYKTYHIHSVFGVAQPRKCPGVPDNLLSPRSTWANDEKYYKAAFKLAKSFRENFRKFEIGCSEEILRGGPQRYAF